MKPMADMIWKHQELPYLNSVCMCFDGVTQTLNEWINMNTVFIYDIMYIKSDLHVMFMNKQKIVSWSFVLVFWISCQKSYELLENSLDCFTSFG